MIARQAVPPRHSLPRRWLLTDERQGEALWDALERLPRGSGVVFRHHRTPADERRMIYERVRWIARRRRLSLILSGPPRLATAWRADGSYGACHHVSKRLRLFPAHNPAEIVAARRTGADAILLSPVFATRSHPGARALGKVRFGLIARAAEMPVIALGGMNGTRWRGLSALRCHGWAGIDAFTAPDRESRQNLKAVPT